MLPLILELVAVLSLMLISAELLSRGVEDLEGSVGQGIAGGVILGNLTALPETLIVVVAVLEHKGNIALGSAIGGNVVLFTLGLGLISIVYFSKWRKHLQMKGDYRHELYVIGIASLIIVGSIGLGNLNPGFSVLLFLLYLYYLLKRAKAGTKSRLDLKSIIEVVVGGAVIVALAPLFVGLIEALSLSLGISQTWVSLAVTPVVAELEEGISAIRLAIRYQGGGSTAVVSYFGSKIQNVTILLGLVGLDFVNTRGPYILLALISNLIGIFVIRDGKLTVVEGIILSLLYFLFLYIAFIFQNSAI
ncbi:sodium:proton exchanger [Metallosphaera hakonensis]|uniref:Sodium:proton exchanger n=1 Tax=Metallosphaera hakonensis JCM 8857 = DSM 7519 TaxID=1293036 RepID=A0A2U9IVM9_9CREN|nr:sodium:proton exchanger [Metallosphaera hakonensis]AWS00131.1 sodium:calcium antiporter [Metallosphaera hakonensis JCM 8857 = DSM 7519]